MRCLKSHMILHSDVELRCDICDYVTKKQHLLKRHLLTQVKLIIFIINKINLCPNNFFSNIFLAFRCETI